MNNALYAAFLGMRARQRSLDVIGNNIANAGATGFKAERLHYSTIEAAQGGAGQQTTPTSVDDNPTRPGSMGVLTGTTTDFSTGVIRETGRPLDIALGGEGFLVVQTPAGERYTRAGSLTLDASGQLVTQRGHLVVGESGPLTLPPGEVSVGEDGTVSVGGRNIDRLKLVRFQTPQTALLKEGDSLYTSTGVEQPQADNATRVMQGTLEGSNVNAVSEMVSMMQQSREFDSLQRSVTTLMNDIGRKVSGELGRL